jgi:hypothetical protein
MDAAARMLLILMLAAWGGEGSDWHDVARNPPKSRPRGAHWPAGISSIDGSGMWMTPLTLCGEYH